MSASILGATCSQICSLYSLRVQIVSTWSLTVPFQQRTIRSETLSLNCLMFSLRFCSQDQIRFPIFSKLLSNFATTWFNYSCSLGLILCLSYLQIQCAFFSYIKYIYNTQISHKILLISKSHNQSNYTKESKNTPYTIKLFKTKIRYDIKYNFNAIISSFHRYLFEKFRISHKLLLIIKLIMFSRAVIYLSLIYCIIFKVESQCCQQFASNLCIKCPQNMHLYRSNCIFDLPGCIDYSLGFDCSKCKPNFQLINGTCFHPRFNLSVQNISNYTVYLQSAVKPNLLLTTTLSQLSSNSQIWKSWMKQSALNNRTIMSDTILNKHANILQNRIIGSSGNQPHYIYTTNYLLNSSELIIFRLTYRVIAPYGFADVFIAIESEPSNSSIIYLQILWVQFTELVSNGWSIVDPKSDQKFSNLLNRFFSEMNQQYFLQGYWRQVDHQYNVTLLYMNGQKGVISYNYIIASEDLQALNITLIPENQNKTITNDSTNSNNIPITKNQTVVPETNNIITDNNNSKTTNSSNEKSNITTVKPVSPNNTSQQQVPHNSSTGNQHTNSTSQTQTTSGKASNTSTNEHIQTFLNLSEIQTNPIVATGYAVAVHQNYFPPDSTLEAISYISQNNTYCIYCQALSTHLYYKLIFYVNSVLLQFQIIYFTTSTKSLLPPKVQSQSKNISINTNTNINSSSNNPETPVKNNTKNTTKVNNTVTPIVNNLNQPKNIGYTNSTLIQNCPQLSQFVSIDITGQLTSDLFLPKITLLILKMYGQSLKNCQLVDAKYSWLLDNKTVVNKIIYNITYATILGELYHFDVLIVNNVLSFIKIPANFKENGSKEVTATKSDNNPTPPPPPTPANNSNDNYSNFTNNSSNNITNPITNITNINTTQNTIIIPNANTTNKTNQSVMNNSSQTNSVDVGSNTSSSNKSQKINSTQFDNKNTSANIIIIDNIKNNSLHVLPSKIDNPSPTNSSKQTQNQTKQHINQTTIIPNKNNSTNQEKPNNNTNVISLNKTEVLPASYTKLPQYKSIIQIVRSMKRIPSNSTIFKFLEWVQKSQVFYQITFNMIYAKPLTDGSTVKVFIFEVNVNSSNFVTIVNTTICYKNSNNVTISPNFVPSNPSNVLKTSSIIQKKSPYTLYLYQVLMNHSPGLWGSNVIMLDFQILSTDFGGMRTHYSETLRFSTNINASCYEVLYDVTSMIGVPGGKEYVHVKQYFFTNCSEQASNKFLYRLTSVRFSENAIYNNVVNNMIFNISDQHTTHFLKYKQFLNFYKIQYEQAGKGDIQVLIDVDKQIFLLFKQKSKIVYTPYQRLLSDREISLMQKQISINLNLQNTSFYIVYVQKDPLENNYYSALNIFGCSKKSIWGIQLKKYYNIQLFFNQTLHQTIIYNQTQLNINQDNAYSIIFKGIEGWISIEMELLLENSQFSDIMDKLLITYNTFMQNCQIQFVLTPTTLQKQQYFNQSYNSEITLKLLLAKQYTPSYFGNFAITITFIPLTAIMSIKSVEVVPPNSISVLNCQISQPSTQGLPVCSLCQKGYQKVNGLCVSVVPQCVQYYNQLCLRCKQGYESDFFRKCQNIDTIETDIITIINEYLLENSQN